MTRTYKKSATRPQPRDICPCATPTTGVCVSAWTGSTVAV